MSARKIAQILPAARVWIALNGIGGTIDPRHPGIVQILREARCQAYITIPVCRSPEFGLLKNFGRFDAVCMMSEDDLGRHGIPPIRAGRALEGMQDWLLEGCDALRPVVADLLQSRQ